MKIMNKNSLKVWILCRLRRGRNCLPIHLVETLNHKLIKTTTNFQLYHQIQDTANITSRRLKPWMRGIRNVWVQVMKSKTGTKLSSKRVTIQIFIWLKSFQIWQMLRWEDKQLWGKSEQWNFQKWKCLNLKK